MVLELKLGLQSERNDSVTFIAALEKRAFSVSNYPVVLAALSYCETNMKLS